MPSGVHVTTIARSGPTGTTAPLEAQAFMGTASVRGPLATAVLCRSYAEFVATFGQPATAGPALVGADVARSFFEEGGQRLWVGRIAGPDTAAAARTLVDAEDDDTVTITATSVGSWANAVTVAVAVGASGGTFRKLTVAGLPDSAVPVVLDDLTTPASFVAGVNTHPRLAPYLVATDEGSANAAPANRPKVAAAAALAGGDDDLANLTGGEWSELESTVFTPDLGPGVLLTPGPGEAGDPAAVAAGAAAVVEALEALGRTAGDDHRIQLLYSLDGPVSAEDAIGVAETFAAAEALLSGAAGEFASRVGHVPQFVTIPGGRQIPAVGWVAAARARAMITDGPWRAPAGEISQARWVTGIANPYTAAEIDQVGDAGAIPLRLVAGTGGPRVYGWRSMSSDPANWGLLTARDVAHYVGWRCALALEPLVFGTIDSQRRLLSKIEAALVGVVEPIRVAGGLFEQLDAGGQRVDPGYRVDVGEVVNPIEALAANRLGGVVAIRVSPTAQLIELTIVKAALAATL